MMLSIITFGVKIKQIFVNFLIFFGFFVFLRLKPVVYGGKFPMQ